MQRATKGSRMPMKLLPADRKRSVRAAQPRHAGMKTVCKTRSGHQLAQPGQCLDLASGDLRDPVVEHDDSREVGGLRPQTQRTHPDARQFRNLARSRRMGMSQHLHPVHRQKALAVQSLDVAAVGIIFADELATVFAAVVQPRMIASTRDRQRRAAVAPDLDGDSGLTPLPAPASRPRTMAAPAAGRSGSHLMRWSALHPGVSSCGIAKQKEKKDAYQTTT